MESVAAFGRLMVCKSAPATNFTVSAALNLLFSDLANNLCNQG